MTTKSKIEWTDTTWNPVRGCTKISPGCKHCYAEAFAERFRGVKGHPYEQGFDLAALSRISWVEPLRWRFAQDDICELYERTCSMTASSMIYNRGCFSKLWLKSRLAHLSGSNEAFAADGKNSYCPVDSDLPPAAAHIWWGVSVEDKRVRLPRYRTCSTRASSG